MHASANGSSKDFLVKILMVLVFITLGTDFGDYLNEKLERQNFPTEQIPHLSFTQCRGEGNKVKSVFMLLIPSPRYYCRSEPQNIFGHIVWQNIFGQERSWGIENRCSC